MDKGDKASQSWQKVTDLDVMYEHILKFPASDTFINPQRLAVQELNTFYDFLYYRVQPIFTGNVLIKNEQVSFQAEPIDILVLEGLIRVNDKTELIYFELGSEDLPGNIIFDTDSPTEGTPLKTEFLSVKDVLTRLKPGQQLRINVIYQRTNPGKTPLECYQKTGYCTSDF